MADSAVMSETSIPAFEEIPNMKVTDLRKKLKAFGLSITGNKTELVERLQEACYPSKGQDSFETSQELGFDESQISELDSVDDGSAPIEDENALLDHDQFPSYMNSSLEDDSKLLDNTENKPSVISNSVIMSPKKRALIKFDDITPVEKKLTINRTNISHIDFDINTKTKPKLDVAVKTEDSETEKKKVLSLKSMSASERMAMRMKRFNVGGSTTALTSVTNSKAASNKNSKQSIISSTITPDVEVLKKRAQRFGQNVSTVMKQIEEKEKLLKRKCKFGAHLGVSAVTSLDEQEKKRQRKERFAIS